MRVNITDWGRPEYLDGAMMQFMVTKGEFPNDLPLAYCINLETARALANALIDHNDEVIIIGPRP